MSCNKLHPVILFILLPVGLPLHGETIAIEANQWVPPTLPSSLCQGLRNSLECAEAVEDYVLRHPPGRIVRSGPSLSIGVGAGDLVRFIDEPERGPRFNYFGMMSTNHHLVHVQHYEHQTYLLVDPGSGARIETIGLPLPSPNGHRIAAMSTDSEGLEATLQVIRLGGPTDVVYRQAIHSTEAPLVYRFWWIDGNSIRVNGTTSDGTTRFEDVLSYKGGQWRLASNHRTRGAD